MTPKQMHIEVEQGLQRVASYVFDDFLPEEIDLVLNKSARRFIDDKFRKDKTSEGYEIQQGDLDDIQFLIEKDVELPAFIDIASGKSYCVLPSNYLYLINDRSKVNDNCKISEFNQLTPYTEENVSIFPFPNSNLDTPPYYDTFVITYKGNIIFNIEDYTISEGLSSNEAKFVIIDLVLDELRQKLPYDIIGIYWEQYRNNYNPDSFIIITKEEVIDNTSINIDGTITNITSTQTPNLQVSSLTPLKEVANRLTKSEKLHQVLNDNVYFKTIARSPISNLSKDLLYVYFNKKYIVTSIIIDYIRIPRNISLYLNRSCELDENTHRRIVDLSVEYLKNTIEQPSYDSKVRDNILRSE